MTDRIFHSYLEDSGAGFEGFGVPRLVTLMEILDGFGAGLRGPRFVMLTGLEGFGAGLGGPSDLLR